jgi:hypothetical protein
MLVMHLLAAGHDVATTNNNHDVNNNSWLIIHDVELARQQ